MVILLIIVTKAKTAVGVNNVPLAPPTLKYVTIATRHSLYLINKVYTSKPSNL